LGASVCATAADPSRASTAAIGKIRIETSIEDTFAARDSSGRNFQALQVNPENVSRRCDGHRRGTDSIQASNQSIDREFADATGGKRGNIRLLQPKHDGSLGLGKLPTFDDSPEFVNKLGLEKLFFRIGKTKVGEDVAAACGCFPIVAHLSPPFPWFSR
jgi:hypothetical protein